MNIPNWYIGYKNFIDKSINSYLDTYFEPEGTLSKPLEEFKEAIYYSVKGGKRIRSILALEFYLQFSKKELKDIGKSDDIIVFCIAIELLHAYSLVHDDLPCMDNDEYRRGELTVWKKYSQETAVLVGDSLNSMAFEMFNNFSDEVNIKAILKLFGKSVGIYGMVGGQVEDLYFENNYKELDLDLLKSLENKKTGALIKASILGGIIISAEKKGILNLDKYQDFGEKIGLAFQLKDDLLDIEGTLEETGKSVGGEKKGFVYFMGIEKTKQELHKLISEARGLIKDLSSEKLVWIVDYIEKRIK